MDAAEPQFVCQPHVYRHSHDDDQRTRILKEVLRSTAALQEQQNKGKSRSRTLLLLEGPSPTAARIIKRTVAPTTVTWRDLAACQDRDEQCLAAAGAAADGGDASPASPLLRGCGTRIAGLCAKLEDAEATLSRVQSETKLAASPGISPDSEIRITERPEESAGVVRARNDLVVYDFVKNHATFDRLEAFKDTVEKAQDFESLRKVFPRKHHYHPSLQHMNDDVLKDPRKLKAAIWAPQAFREADGRGLAEIQKTRLQSRAAVGLRVSTNTSGSTLAQRRAVARGMRKDRSLPSL